MGSPTMLIAEKRNSLAQVSTARTNLKDAHLRVLPHLQGNIEIGRHKDRNAEVGNTKHRIY